jgi:hypothetical protein
VGEHGPVPKRSSQRRRTNTPAAGEPKVAPGGTVVEVPAADPDWHPVALRWFESLGGSGQSAFYESSDWMTAFVVAESMSRELKPQPVVVGTGRDAKVEMHAQAPKAASVAAWLKASAALLATEGDRRRVALELTRGKVEEEGPADVAHLNDARARLRGAG